jgi:hypothetical protein
MRLCTINFQLLKTSSWSSFQAETLTIQLLTKDSLQSSYGHQAYLSLPLPCHSCTLQQCGLFWWWKWWGGHIGSLCLHWVSLCLTSEVPQIQHNISSRRIWRGKYCVFKKRMLSICSSSICTFFPTLVMLIKLNTCVFWNAPWYNRKQ